MSDDTKRVEGLDEKKGSENVINTIKKGLLQEKTVKKSEFIFAIIANLVILFIANNLLNWNLSFVTVTFSQVLGAINLSIGVTILGNILFIIYNPSWFRHAMKALMNLISFIAAYIFYVVFPLNFSQTYMVIAVKIVLIIVLVVMIFSIAFEIFKLLFGIYYRSKT